MDFKQFSIEQEARLRGMENTVSLGFKSLKDATDVQTEVLKEMKDQLIGPATSKNQVPMKVFLVVVLCMSILFVMDKAFHTDLNLEVSRSGLSIEKD